MRHRLLQILVVISVFGIALVLPFAHASQADPLPPGQCAYVDHYPTGVGAEACTPWD